MTIWFVSDTHISHRNIRNYCPWRKTWAASIDEMDAKIIEEWNKAVQPGDTIYHLGDVAFAQKGDKPTRLRYLRSILNGHVKVAVGNHDHSVAKMIEYGYDAAHNFELIHEGVTITMRHDPRRFRQTEVAYSTILLHGHSHGKPQPPRYGADSFKMFDVGVDAVQSIRPLTFEELVFRFQQHRNQSCLTNLPKSS